jgi:hypothetical protein
LFTVAALGLALILAEVRLLTLIEAGSLLVLAGPVLIEVGLLTGPLLTQVPLVGSLLPQASLAALLRQIVSVHVSKLLLIQVLVEMGLGEIVGAIVGVQIVAIDIVRVDVVPVDVVGIDVIAIDVVIVGVTVIVIAINECARVRNVGIVVVYHGVVVPAAVPRVPSPTAASTTANGSSDRYADAERNQARGNHRAG